MKTCKILLSLLFFMSLVLFFTIASAKTLFFDDFEDGKIDKAFKFTGQDPKWVEKGGALSQTKKSVGDVCHAIIVDREYPKAITIQAKLRVDEWESGAYARSGISVRVNLAGNGLCFLFSDHRVAKPRTGAAFLNDHVAWGPGARLSNTNGM